MIRRAYELAELLEGEFFAVGYVLEDQPNLLVGGPHTFHHIFLHVLDLVWRDYVVKQDGFLKFIQ